MPESRSSSPPIFHPGVRPPREENLRAVHFAFRGDRLLVSVDHTDVLPSFDRLATLGVTHEGGHYLGRLGDADCWAIDLPDACEAPDGFSFEGLRRVHGRLDDALFAAAGRAIQVVEWDRTHRFCGRCGIPTEPLETERARRCPRCELLVYPRISPAVIMLVERGDAILLARGVRFATPFYSALAGFVEPGETLEEAVAREVREEVGIEIRDIRYFASQPWPFPNSLMIGFTAQHASGEIQIDPVEISDAGWFVPPDLPELPSPISIARRLIDAAVACRADQDPLAS